jgi:hypothetical protein
MDGSGEDVAMIHCEQAVYNFGKLLLDLGVLSKKLSVLFANPSTKPMRLFTLFFLFLALASRAQFPDYQVTATGPQAPGYYFVNPFLLTSPTTTQMILDETGELLYYHRFTDSLTLDFKLQPNGLISYGYGHTFYLMDSTFTVVDSVSCKNGVETDTHDLQVLPNGHFLMIGLEYYTQDLSGYNYFLHNGSPGSSNATVLGLVVQEQDSARNVVFEWHAKDYLPFDSVDPFWLNDSAWVDWTHSNAVCMDQDGNILVSSRHLNEITKINRSDSTVMWRFGGNYNQFSFTGDTLPFYGQHDIRRIANGHVTLYDDGNHVVPHPARALEYDLDETNMTAGLYWSYIYDTNMFAWATGNVQRLQNGNTLVNYGVNQNTRNIHFNVVDSLGNEAFRLVFTDTLFGYRSFRYPALPWSLTRPVITCFDSAGTHYLDAGPGYAGYQWNDGSTAQLRAVTDTGTYFVFVQAGAGGFISSERTVVTDTSMPCGPTALLQPEVQPLFSIYPNPVERTLILHTVSAQGTGDALLIYDSQGRLQKTAHAAAGQHLLRIDVSDLNPGMYFARMGETTMSFIRISR